MNILAVDVGGTHVKVMVTGQTVERKVVSGPTMTAADMVDAVKKMTADWMYDAVSIGYPGPVAHGAPVKEPANLGPGWVGFDFAAAFGRPVKIINDAAMQALGSDQGGRMLFLGLGTGLGSAMVVDGRVEPLELAHLPYKDKLTYEDLVGLRGQERLAFDVPVTEHSDNMDQISSLADPEKNLVRPLGILGIEIDKKVAAMAPDLRDPFGIIVAARSSDARSEIPLTTGDVIRTLNGQPMTTLDRLRSALAELKPGAPVVLQIQRDDRLLYISFTL